MRGNLLGRWLAVSVVLCLMIGCSSEAEEESPPVPLPTIEIPEEPSEVASTETPSADEATAATPPGEQPQDSGGKPEDEDVSNESTGGASTPE